MKKVPTIICDLDCTLVDMLEPWLWSYNQIKGTNIKVSDIKEYNVGKVCTDENVLYSILNERNFFFDMEPMPGAVKYFQKLLDDGYDVVIATQPPRKAEFAVRDKRRWVQKYFPKFLLENMVFCHRKELIIGDIIFDDSPTHLMNWKKGNSNGLLATLDWKFNKKVRVDFRGSLKNGWREFYNWIKNKDLQNMS